MKITLSGLIFLTSISTWGMSDSEEFQRGIESTPPVVQECIEKVLALGHGGLLNLFRDGIAMSACEKAQMEAPSCFVSIDDTRASVIQVSETAFVAFNDKECMSTKPVYDLKQDFIN